MLQLSFVYLPFMNTTFETAPLGVLGWVVRRDRHRGLRHRRDRKGCNALHEPSADRTDRECGSADGTSTIGRSDRCVLRGDTGSTCVREARLRLLRRLADRDQVQHRLTGRKCEQARDGCRIEAADRNRGEPERGCLQQDVLCGMAGFGGSPGPRPWRRTPARFGPDQPR